MVSRLTIAVIVLAGLSPSALAQGILVLPEPRPFLSPTPFTQTLSNNTPLAFGMTPDDTAAALQAPLTYVRGRPGDEMFVAPRPQGGSGYFPREGRMYLQFRRYRLTGWKGDWERNWMWR